MIHVIGKHNRHLYADILEDMYRIRHKIFVETKGWVALAREDGREIDEFDNDETTYFLKLSQDMEILGGMRIYPTTGNTQLNTFFADRCQLKPAPLHKDHYEWSRYFIVEPNHRDPRTRAAVHVELYLGIFEYVETMGIHSLSGFIEMPTFMHTLRMPWHVDQLGVPAEYGGTNGEPIGVGLPVQVWVDKSMIQKTRKAWHCKKAVLSASFGEFTPYNEAGYSAEIIHKVSAFMHEHPAHVGVLAAFHDCLHDPDPSVSSSISRFVDKEINRESMNDFSSKVLTSNVPHAGTLTLQ
jgi:acyl-homoserine lactone synthase